MLKQSSRRTPCPICGRNTDADCRFNDALILCHCGTRFGPPQDLRIGDVLQIEGRSWALIRTRAGYDGAAHEFRPNSGAPRRALPKARQIGQRSLATSTLRKVLLDVDAALAAPEFIHQLPDELRTTWALIDAAAANCTAFKPTLAEAARHNPTLREHLDLLADAAKQLRCQQQDANYFRSHFLGEIIS